MKTPTTHSLTGNSNWDAIESTFVRDTKVVEILTGQLGTVVRVVVGSTDCVRVNWKDGEPSYAQPETLDLVEDKSHVNRVVVFPEATSTDLTTLGCFCRVANDYEPQSDYQVCVRRLSPAEQFQMDLNEKAVAVSIALKPGKTSNDTDSSIRSAFRDRVSAYWHFWSHGSKDQIAGNLMYGDRDQAIYRFATQS